MTKIYVAYDVFHYNNSLTIIGFSETELGAKQLLAAEISQHDPNEYSDYKTATLHVNNKNPSFVHFITKVFHEDSGDVYEVQAYYGHLKAVGVGYSERSAKALALKALTRALEGEDEDTPNKSGKE